MLCRQRRRKGVVRDRSHEPDAIPDALRYGDCFESLDLRLRVPVPAGDDNKQGARLIELGQRSDHDVDALERLEPTRIDQMDRPPTCGAARPRRAAD